MGLATYELHGNGLDDGEHDGAILLDTSTGIPLPIPRFEDEADAEAFVAWVGADLWREPFGRVLRLRDLWYKVREWPPCKTDGCRERADPADSIRLCDNCQCDAAFEAEWAHRRDMALAAADVEEPLA